MIYFFQINRQNLTVKDLGLNTSVKVQEVAACINMKNSAPAAIIFLNDQHELHFNSIGNFKNSNMEKLASDLLNNLVPNSSEESKSATNNRSAEKQANFEIEIISAQGLLFDNFINDLTHIFYIHVLLKGEMQHGLGIEVVDANRPILFQSSFSSSRNTEDKFGNIVILITCAPKQLVDASSSLVTKPILVAQAILDDRMLQLYSDDYISVELIPCLSDYVYSSVESPGVIFLRPHSPRALRTSPTSVPSHVTELLEKEISLHQSEITKSCRDVFQRLKSWWVRLKGEFSHLESRSIRFITEDESGRHRYVGSFVSPISPGRELDGPRFAARYIKAAILRSSYHAC